MERLTRPDINVNPGTDRFLHAVIGGKEIDWKQSRDSTLNVMINGEDTGLTPEGIKAPFTEDTMVNLAAQALGVEADRLRELAEADKDGRVVVPPCKVGDVVYGFHNNRQTILPMVAKWIETNADGWCIAVQYTPMAPRFYRFSDFGKTVFLTHEEAERAMEGEKDG